MVENKTFREDLYYRLNGINITLPPLRERREDIPLLIENFVREASKEMSLPIKNIEKGVISSLISYDWPGNVRQLKNEIYKLVALSNDTVKVAHISEEILPYNQNKGEEKVGNLPQLLREIEKKEIIKALTLTNNNKSQASGLLGISRFTLQRKIDKLGIHYENSIF